MDIIDIIKNASSPLFLIQMHTLKDLQKDKLFFKPLSDKEYQYLDKIGDDSVINLLSSTDSIKFIDELRKKNKNNKVILTITDKINFNNDLFKSDINYSNVFVKVNTISNPISLDEYVNNEKTLYSMVSGAEKLSPLERYLYAYDVVKRLKEYKEHKKDKLLSRNLYSILFNNYIVCSGFSALLGDLLDKLDIPNAETSVEIDLSSFKASAQLRKKYEWDKIKPFEKYKLVRKQMNFIPSEYGNHSRLIVNINDPKYSVNGLYFSDVTWDNDLNKSFYNHALMTEDKAVNSNHKIKLSVSPCELLYSDSIEQFNDKLNYILNHRNSSRDYSNISDSECLKRIVVDLISIINKLDKEFVNNINSKYKHIDDIAFYENDEYKKLLYELANYIVNSFNNDIDGNTLLSAIKVIYDEVYVGGISSNDTKKIIEDNNSSNLFEFGSNIFKK